MKKLATAFIANFGDSAVLHWNVLDDGTLKAVFNKYEKKWEAVFTVNGTLEKAEAVK